MHLDPSLKVCSKLPKIHQSAECMAPQPWLTLYSKLGNAGYKKKKAPLGNELNDNIVINMS